jgi:hypothetical protein
VRELGEAVESVQFAASAFVSALPLAFQSESLSE